MNGREKIKGRANDERFEYDVEEEHKSEKKGKFDGVKLEYRDAFGNLLTQKEAFRQMSYK